jgi:tetratricopeptide (TPR) repeat protein
MATEPVEEEKTPPSRLARVLANVRVRLSKYKLTLSPTLRLVIASATTIIIVGVMFVFTSRVYAHMSPLALKIATVAKWAIPAVLAIITFVVLLESRKSDSARTVGFLSAVNIALTLLLSLGLEPPPKFSVSELRELKEFNVEFDGVRITPDLERIAKGVELSNETDPLRLAQSKLARGKLEDALRFFDRSLAEMKDMEKVIAETHFYRAVALSRLDREEEAIVEADLAHAILPHMSLASFMKCRSLRRLLRFDEALSTCNLAIQEDPTNGWAWGEKGGVLSEIGMRAMDRDPSFFEESIAASDICIRLLPKNPAPWNNKAVALQRLNRLPEAIAAADRALALQPDFADALLNKARALKHMGRLDEAAAIYQEMTRKTPFFPEAWNNLGDTFEERGKFSEALQYYSAATQQRSNYEDAWYNKGHMLNLLGRYGEAAVALGRAVELNDKDDAAFFQQAVALHHLGKRLEAIKSLDRAIALNPNFSEARKLRTQVKRGK